MKRFDHPEIRINLEKSAVNRHEHSPTGLWPTHADAIHIAMKVAACQKTQKKDPDFFMGSQGLFLRRPRPDSNR